MIELPPTVAAALEAAQATPCEICDRPGDLAELRGVWAHTACFPTHWTKGPRGRTRKWDVGSTRKRSRS